MGNYRNRDAAKEILGKEIQELIAKSGMSDKELYEKLGVSKRTLQNWKSGTYAPGYLEMLEIKARLSVGSVKQYFINQLKAYNIHI